MQFDYFLEGSRAQVLAASVDHINGMNQMRSRSIFENVTGGAGVETSSDHLFFFVHREDEDFGFGFRLRLQDTMRRLKAAQIRHGDIHEDDIRKQSLGLGDCLAPVIGFAYNLDRKFVLEDRLDSFAEQRLIVAEQNSNFSLHASSVSRRGR